MKTSKRFYSGFCFANEEELFSSLTTLHHPYTLSGFSYGAILAFKQALLRPHLRLQTLNLFSPAFFQDKTPAFLKTQILGFRKNPQSYINHFLNLCGNPKQKFFKQGTLDELEELLYFQWKEQDLQTLQKLGVQINVFLGGKDLIISPQKVSEFFAPYATIYLYKDLNHCLSHDHL